MKGGQTNMTEQTEDWNNFCGKRFLKTSDVVDEKDAFVVEDIEVFNDDESPKLRTYMGKGDDVFIFDLNVTNSNFCKNAGVKTPKALLGKKIFFKKVLVNSPKTKKEVESLRICKVE